MPTTISAKPFGVGELLARVRAVLRRKVAERAETSSVFHFGNVEVDLVKRRVTKRGEEVHLTAIEYRLLSTMVANFERVITTGRYFATCGALPTSGVTTTSAST